MIIISYDRIGVNGKIPLIYGNKLIFAGDYDILLIAIFRRRKMEINNICKFNLNRSSDLICLNFIYETQNRQAETRRAENCFIGLAVKGEGELVCGSERYLLKVGTLFFVLGGENFSVRSCDGLEYSYIEFRGRRADEYMDRFGITENNRVFEGNEALVSFWGESIDMADAGNVDILSEAVLLYSLAKLKPLKKEQSDIISKMITFTSDNFTDSDLSVSTVAHNLGYDAKYLSSVFKKRKGIPYTQYLRELRIKRAVFLIEEGVVSVKNIALLSGFRDALYFSKLFTKTEGMSPKAYIAEHSKKGS